MAYAPANSVFSPEGHTRTSIPVGTIQRSYGLLTSEETITIAEIHDRQCDLAVADRIAFVWAARAHGQIAVVEHEGWYAICTLDRYLTPEQATLLQPASAGGRLMSVVDGRGIVPVVGPLAG